MSYKTLRVVAATSIVVAVVLLQMCEVSGLSCIRCSQDLQCPTLPDDCEPATRPCGCCPECKGKVGATCSNFGLGCESRLMCVHKLGLAISFVKWDYFRFKGECQEVEMCQLVKRSYFELVNNNYVV